MRVVSWLVALLVLVIGIAAFMWVYGRRLAARTGPWITGPWIADEVTQDD